MEEITRQRQKYSSSKGLSRLLSKHRPQQQLEQARILARMNQCFNHMARTKNKQRQPLQPIKELTWSSHLRKNQNKIQQNILRHQDAQLRGTVSRGRDLPKRTQLIVNKTHYQQYFTPKTQEQILLKWRDELENYGLSGKSNLKSPLTSLHVEREDCTQESNPVKRLNLKKKVVKNSFSRRHDSIESFKEPSMLFSTCHGFNTPNKEISRYNKQELKGYYQSLTKFSRDDPKQYKDGLQTMLNLMNVPCNEKILTQEFTKFKANPTFEEFLSIYTKIIDAALRENVMDFFDIIFEECGVGELDKEKLGGLLSERMRPSQAIEIVDQIFFLIAPDGKSVQTSDILTLCCTNDEFCWFMRQFSILDTKKK